MAFSTVTSNPTPAPMTRAEVSEIIAKARATGEQINLRKANLRGTDLSGLDLRRADLRKADLRDADLSQSNLCWAVLSGARLYEANLGEADLRWANLSWTNLSRAKVRGANLVRANMYRADLLEADLREADLLGVDLREADAPGFMPLSTPIGTGYLIATPDGWRVALDGWRHRTIVDFRALAMGWPAPTCAERDRGRPVLLALLAYVEAHASYHEYVVAGLRDYWR